jgi:hypothetical protein
MSSSKKFTRKGILRQVFICLGSPPLLWPHTPPPLHTVSVYTLYSILNHTGNGGRGESEPEKRLEGQQFAKLGRKYQHDWLYIQSINSNKHLLQSPFFRWRHFAVVSVLLISQCSSDSACRYSFMPIGMILIKSNAELTGLAPGLGSVSETRTVLLMKSLDP